MLPWVRTSRQEKMEMIMSTILQARASRPEFPLSWPRLTAILRVAMDHIIANRQAKADRTVKEHLERLGLQHPRDLCSRAMPPTPAKGEAA